jgi:DNA-binding CsgD family transcriptional regulator
VAEEFLALRHVANPGHRRSRAVYAVTCTVAAERGVCVVKGSVRYREIGVGLVARALDCVAVWLVQQDARGRLDVTTWDHTDGVTRRGRTGDVATCPALTGLPMLRPALDATGAIVLAVRAAETGLVGWRLIGAVAYGAGDVEVAVRMVSVLADPAMLDGEIRRPSHMSGVLTARESEVLTLVSHGLTARAVARRCGISERTVQKHLEQAYRKLDCHDRLSAVLLARDSGLLTGKALVPAT